MQSIRKHWNEIVFGLPMSSPLSPMLANLVLQDLESDILKNKEIKISMYKRYVDDIL